MSVIVRAGPMRQTMQLITPTEAADAYGEQDITWATDSTVHRAAVHPIFGNESLCIYQKTPETTHAIRMRYLSTIVPKYRLLIDGTRVFEIVGIMDTELRGHEMMVACKDLGEAPPATSITVEIEPTKDLYIRSNATTANFDTLRLFTGRSGGGVYRTMMHFNLSAYIGRTVSVAEIDFISLLELTPTYASYVRRMIITTWDETTATWNTSDGSTAWSPANVITPQTGPYTTDDEVAVNLPTGSSLGNANLFTIAGLATLAQDAITNRSGHLHIIIMSSLETDNFQGRPEFYDKEDGGFSAGSAPPKLRMTYT